MSREIELKIPLSLEQFEKIEKILTQKESLSSVKIRALSHILKSDEYFSLYKSHEERLKNKELRVIRIRTENDGKGEKSFFCIKQKTLENGVEFNSEKETFIEDADVLRSFFAATGYIKWFEKKKDALSLYCSVENFPGFEAHLELEKVNGLPYAEIEYTKDDFPPEEVRANLEKILVSLGLDPKKRDSRSWAEIINSECKMQDE
ncbi:MAG: hypothetical protein J6I53_11380 [Treponema sp.]|nr:hypothetical protein [Treponema sp.]